MKTIDIKSLLIGGLLTSTILLDVACGYEDKYNQQVKPDAQLDAEEKRKMRERLKEIHKKPQQKEKEDK